MRTIVITQQPITDQKITIKVPEVAQALMRRRKLELRLNGAAANRSFASISIMILLVILFYFIFYFFCFCLVKWSPTAAIQIQYLLSSVSLPVGIIRR